MVNTIEMIGRKFGKLTVIGKSEMRTSNGEIKWICSCECGKTTIVKGSNLRGGKTKSCGCGVVDGLRAGWKKEKHGGCGTRLYGIWRGMKNRATEKADKKHKKDYYDRGIRICDEWEHSFENFREWALSNGYADDLTIDRIDVNGGYCPENCRWITLAEQANNRRSNRNYTFDGKTQNIAQWARELNISEDMLRERLVLLGWSIEDALLKPSQRRGLTNEQRQLAIRSGAI